MTIYAQTVDPEAVAAGISRVLDEIQRGDVYSNAADKAAIADDAIQLVRDYGDDLICLLDLVEPMKKLRKNAVNVPREISEGLLDYLLRGLTA